MAVGSLPSEDLTVRRGTRDLAGRISRPAVPPNSSRARRYGTGGICGSSWGWSQSWRITQKTLPRSGPRSWGLWSLCANRSLLHERTLADTPEKRRPAYSGRDARASIMPRLPRRRVLARASSDAHHRSYPSGLRAGERRSVCHSLDLRSFPRVPVRAGESEEIPAFGFSARHPPDWLSGPRKVGGPAIRSWRRHG
jgi:hypothetical protein